MISSTIPLAQGWSIDGKHDFHAPLEISRHPICATEIDLLLGSLAEHEDASVLQETIDDAANVDVLGDARQTGPQATDAANDQINGHARLTGLIQRLDRAAIDERVELREDPRPFTATRPLGLFVNELDGLIVQVLRGDAASFCQSWVWEYPVSKLKSADTSSAIVLSRRKQSQVGVLAGRRWVVVAGPQVDEAAQPSCPLAELPTPVCSGSSGP